MKNKIIFMMKYIYFNIFCGGLVFCLFSEISFAHSDEGIHNYYNLHNIEKFYNSHQQIDHYSQEYLNQLELEQYFLQDTMLWIIVRQAYPNLANDRVLKILDFIKVKSKLWNFKDYNMLNENCPKVKDLVISYVADEDELAEILGLSIVNAKTLFHYFEISLKKSPLSYKELNNDSNYSDSITISLNEPVIAMCYVFHHQDDLINAGIINLKKYINSLDNN